MKTSVVFKKCNSCDISCDCIQIRDDYGTLSSLCFSCSRKLKNEIIRQEVYMRDRVRASLKLKGECFGSFNSMEKCLDCNMTMECNHYTDYGDKI